MIKLYEVEIQRRNISPKQFFSYCRREVLRRTEGKCDLESWVEYNDWNQPIEECEEKYHHGDWDFPQYEECKMKPYDWHLVLEHNYNFIMEFVFDDDKKGHGYLFIRVYDDNKLIFTADGQTKIEEFVLNCKIRRGLEQKNTVLEKICKECDLPTFNNVKRKIMNVCEGETDVCVKYRISDKCTCNLFLYYEDDFYWEGI